MLKRVEAGVLSVAYEETGDADGAPVLLLHGFPYDVRAYDEATPILASRGCRVITPYLRGYGPTSFLSPHTPRSGQQAVLAHDLLALMDALGISRAVLAGYDWGGRAACIVAALWPRARARAGVGRRVQHPGHPGIHPAAGAGERVPPLVPVLLPRRARPGGSRAQSASSCASCCGSCGRPTGASMMPTYERTAASFDNPDFVDVVIHSYRHRFGLVPGDPAVEDTERRLAAQPPIAVPSIALDGGGDGVMPWAAPSTTIGSSPPRTSAA